MENLHYICGRKVKRTVTYRNNIRGTSRNKIRTTKPSVLMPILSNKKSECKNGDAINGNEISTYDQAYDING